MNFLKKYPEHILLSLFAIVGVITLNSYGYAWDERDQREIGLTCYNYIFNNNLQYLSLGSRDHGAIFELFLVIIEKLLRLTSDHDIYIMRHLVSHLFFLLSAFYLYKLIVFIYNNNKLAVFGFLLLVINPTIYGHSFFNSKDVTFLSMLIICFYQFAISFKYKKVYQFILLALFSSFLVNIRIMGILFVSFVLFFLLIDFLAILKEKGAVKKYILLFVLFGSATIIFTIGTWPLLWEHPLDNFLYAVKNLSKFPWPGNVLFNGKLTSAHDLTWTYIPTWFIINTPIMYLLLGFSGLILFLLQLLKVFAKIDLKMIDKNNLLYVFSFLVPVFVVIFLNSVLYDSWRHLFYIYPAFIMLAVYFINYCLNTKFIKVVFIMTALSISATSFYIITYFPFHHVYFNPIIAFKKNEFIRKNYDMDYWGVGYNKALEYILQIDNKRKIFVYAPNPPCEGNTVMLPKKDQKRFAFIHYENKPDYFITNYRDHPEDYNNEELEEVKSFTILNNKLITIFKFKK
ncbi:MAG: glycosyltransferase family 39 protein [Bacteroidia bacterium]|nr:glycosyltransferase family 39 protein [Bacteroidia bacterium]